MKEMLEIIETFKNEGYDVSSVKTSKNNISLFKKDNLTVAISCNYNNGQKYYAADEDGMPVLYHRNPNSNDIEKLIYDSYFAEKIGFGYTIEASKSEKILADDIANYSQMTCNDFIFALACE